MQPWHIALSVLLVAGVIGVVLWQLLRMPQTTSSSPHSRSHFGYSVWCYRGGNWEMLENHSAPGYVPGPPPTEPGEYDGHSVQVTSVPPPRR